MNSIKKIIWLDDDIEFMKAAEPLFNNYDFELVKCISIAQALQAINNKVSNFLLLDVDFPNNKKEGIIFLEELRKTQPKLNVVIFTGYSDSDDAVRAIKDLNAIGYIKKPILAGKKDEIIFFKKMESYYNSTTKGSNSLKTFWKNEVIIAALIGAIAVIAAAIIPFFSEKIKNNPQQNSQSVKEQNKNESDSVANTKHSK
ncbi:MAG TPA: response regulator [Saprospiraceae bacterium]|nr:response regulator [Saprospiraceae bacterium]